MKPISLLLAWRYILGTKHKAPISTMVVISLLGIIIGSFSLALVISIMNGFEKVTHEKMQGIHPQIIVHTYDGSLDFDAIRPILQQEFPELQAFSANAQQNVILQEQDSDDITNVVMLKGIDPTNEALVTSLATKITATHSAKEALTTILANNQLLIGEKMAQLLEVQPGDSVSLLFTPEEHARTKRITLEQTGALIGGTFNTGIEEFDTGIIFCSLEHFATVFPETGITQINIKLTKDADEDSVIAALRKRFDLDVYSWKTLYPALLSALKLEKYAMFFILALITLVASMSIISLLFMQITQKRGDIAILKAMGATDADIRTIFLFMGMGIALLGSLIGLTGAYLSGLLLQAYPFITLPDVYYVTHLPVYMEWHLFALVFIVIMVLSFIATWIPVRKTQNISITDVLRFEA